jgi:hypothetical protein
MKGLLFKFILVLTICTLVLSIPGISVQAASSCQCVQYIKNRYQLSGSVGGSGGAKDMGSYLRDRGFVQLNSPSVGAVVILKPSFGRGVDGTYGHVAVITAVQDLSSDWRITIKGSNQGSSVWTEYECTNVASWQPSSYPKSFGTDKVEYWTRNLALGRSSSATSIQGSGYEAGKGNDGNTSSRWSSAIRSTTTEWWIVDLGSTRTFDRVWIRWEAAYSRRYFVGVSNDGKNFTGYSYTSSAAGYYSYNLGVRSARYVGIQMKEKAPGLGNYSFWEFIVFANSGASAGY